VLELEEEFADFQRKIGTDGMLFILGQETDQLWRRWDELQNLNGFQGKGWEAGGNQWQAVVDSLHDLGNKVGAEQESSVQMANKLQRALDHSLEIIDTIEPQWDFCD